MVRHVLLWLVAACLSSSLGSRREYVHYPGVGYYYMPDYQMNWFGGYSTCQFDGFDIVVINSVAEELVVKQILTNAGRFQTFVGVTDILWAGDHVALTGESISQTGFQKWLGGSPIQDTKRRCVEYNMNGGLSKVVCSQQGYVICERPLWSVDYQFIPGIGYYKLYPEGDYWSNAWRTCRGDGANLAVIDSALEYDALQDIISEHPDLPESTNSSRFHIGLQGHYKQAYFVTVHGVPVKRSFYNEWETGHPTYNSAFAHLLRNGVLTSTYENMKLAFICEHTLI